MNEEFDYILMHSILVMTFLTCDGQELDIADSEYEDKYIIDELKFVEEFSNQKLSFESLEEGLRKIFVKKSAAEFLVEQIFDGLERERTTLEKLKGISVFIGSNNPNYALSERESIEIDLHSKTIETESWEEK